ncbi:MAG: YkgJ family cysteine cluster protein [candidate division Zixibacteria bacterium]|nr:YkgJ family cysteine cluster protein [candidate division Zixibacteria bacterium]
MKLGDARKYLANIDQSVIQTLEERYSHIKEPLGPDSRFKFSCDADGRCCTNRKNEPIILSSYDVLRLRKRLGMKTRDFLKEYTYMTFGSDSQLPVALLKTKEGEKTQPCVFLKKGLCGVHEDKPLRCRLYPLGRIMADDGTSYFFLQNVPSYCQVGRGKEWTLEEYLKESEIESFTDWSDRLLVPLLEMDFEKYKALPLIEKVRLASFMYDFDFWVDDAIKEGFVQGPPTDEMYMEFVEQATIHFIEKVVGYRQKKLKLMGE